MSNHGATPEPVGSETDRSAKPKSFQRHHSTTRQAEEAKVRQDHLLDEALEETFPASDPLSSLNFTN